jgi:hypothetical protein
MTYPATATPPARSVESVKSVIPLLFSIFLISLPFDLYGG